MIKFYYNTAPNPTKVARCLEEMGLPYELVPVDTRAKPLLGIVEMEAGEPADADQARDDLLDVDVRRVVAEIDQAERLRSERLRRHQTRTPIGDDGGVESRLVKLVFEE